MNSILQLLVLNPSPEDSTRPRCAGWRVLKIPALACVSIGWEPDDAAEIGGRAMIGNSVTGSGGAVLKFECDRDDPAWEVVACTDSSTGLVQIIHRLDPDWGMCWEYGAGEGRDISVGKRLGSRKFEIWREDMGWAWEVWWKGKWCSSN